VLDDDDAAAHGLGAGAIEEGPAANDADHGLWCRPDERRTDDSCTVARASDLVKTHRASTRPAPGARIAA
jgi:hypothetical protein